ncbi:hypothetical protein [Chitinophaga varians]|uniref:hypothetical protein n=1 Tax=Chitinophaga varians TaxID=2202339 RepID=UPI00165F06AF|nr:hypothetical protein [Chitinophaga varians]MBC9909096.1 hypothetical protein [Chitinophaga varians]
MRKSTSVFALFFIFAVKGMAQIRIGDISSRGSDVIGNGRMVTIQTSGSSTIRIVDGFVDTSRLTTGFTEVKRIHNKEFNAIMNFSDSDRIVEIFNTPNTPFEDFIYQHFSDDFLFKKVDGVSFYSKRPLLMNGKLLDSKQIKCIFFTDFMRSRIRKIDYLSEQSLDRDMRTQAPFGVIKVEVDLD